MSRTDTLRRGVEILDAVMRPAGFGFEQVHDGAYACGRYRRADRTLELHFSDSLRLVSQRIGDLVVMHDDFMRALVGPAGGRYPSASTEPLDGFRGLRADLREHCGEFLQMEDTRRDARSAFAAHDFARVVALYEPLEKLLMPAERRRLEIARERARTGRRDGW